MQVLAINGSYRTKGTTARLLEAALEGAASKGASTDVVMLRDRNIQWCTNCLKCYNDLESPLGPCSVDDDMTAILEQVQRADGILFGSPIHNGFLTALMTLFIERMVWRVCRPTGTIGGLRGTPEPRQDKVRALASIVSAGGMPARLRSACDGTPWLKENCTLYLNGFWVGDMYAAADLVRLPESDEEWARMYHLRRLSASQIAKARELGERLAETIARGDIRPTPPMGRLSEVIARVVTRYLKLYKTVDESEA
ncbi:MAG: flavodoxin family protein [Proteobacteria bacterium]|nr:flavodoxin family protein [Pseudomonadota bacterium]